MGCFVMEGWSLEMEVYVIRDCWDCCYEFFMYAGRYPGGGERARIGLLSRYRRTDLFRAVMSSLADSIWVISFFLFPLSFRHYPIIRKKTLTDCDRLSPPQRNTRTAHLGKYFWEIFLLNWYLLNILLKMIFRTLIFLPQAEFQYKLSFAPTRFTGKWNG